MKFSDAREKLKARTSYAIIRVSGSNGTRLELRKGHWPQSAFDWEDRVTVTEEDLEALFQANSQPAHASWCIENADCNCTPLPKPTKEKK